VVAIAARDLNRAQEFADRFGIPKAYASYQELAEDSNIEVVYIGNLIPQHMEVGLLMLEHGKHVLVEKPLTLNEKQSRKLIDCAERKKLFLMEAIWSRFFPSYQYIRKQIENGMLGDIVSVDVEFGFDLSKVDRLIKKDLGGGSLLDLGVYTIQISQWAFQQAPKSIKATGKLNEDGVDLEIQAEINYGEDRLARIQTSALKELGNTAKIVGTKGEITIPSFWCPISIIDVDGTEKTWPLPEAKYKFNFNNSCGLRYEAEEVRKCIREGKTESELVPHSESLIIAQIEDSIRQQIGFKFPEDD